MLTTSMIVLEEHFKNKNQFSKFSGHFLVFMSNPSLMLAIFWGFIGQGKFDKCLTKTDFLIRKASHSKTDIPFLDNKSE